MIKGVQLPSYRVCKGVQKKGLPCNSAHLPFKSEPKKLMIFADFSKISFHYYNGVNF